MPSDKSEDPSPQLLANPDAKQRFLHEAQAAAFIVMNCMDEIRTVCAENIAIWY